MAPRTTSRKTRDIDYSNVGKTGRRTGITLKERQRDEHGFEIIDGSMFESPEKSPPKRNGAVGKDSDQSESMDVQESTLPEPTEFLLSRKFPRSSDRPILPPPRARSPIKTSLGSSPRRTPNPRSSPGRTAPDETPSRISLTGPKRLLNFPQTAPNLTADSSPWTKPRGRKSAVLSESKPREQETAFDEPESTYLDESMNMIDDRAIDIDEVTNAYTNGDPGDSLDVVGDDPVSDPPVEDIDPMGNKATVISGEGEAVAGLEEDDEPQEEIQEEEAVEVEQDEEPQEAVTESQPRASRTKPKRTLFSNARNRGHKRKSPFAEPEFSATATKRVKGKGQPGLQGVDDSQLSIGQSKRGRGRPKTKKENVVYQDSDPENSAPIEKAKRGPKPKDPNTKLSARQSKEVEELLESIKDRPRRPHNLYILRRETPADDSVTHTRSGRTSVRPLAYWRNERCVYGDGEAAVGERFPLATIKEVIRNDEVEIPGSKRGKARGKRRRARQESEDEEVDNELDIWEEEPGIMSQEVLRWDSQLQEAIDVSETLDVAYSRMAIETHEVKNASFKYAKMLSLPFFGTGFVDLPPGGEKRSKNSRKMHMCFFVYSGRVIVEVAGNKFGLAKGGLWQVPRGNQYSIANESDKLARIFFAQSCEKVADGEEE